MNRILSLFCFKTSNIVLSNCCTTGGKKKASKVDSKVFGKNIKYLRLAKGSTSSWSKATCTRPIDTTPHSLDFK